MTEELAKLTEQVLDASGKGAHDVAMNVLWLRAATVLAQAAGTAAGTWRQRVRWQLVPRLVAGHNLPGWGFTAAATAVTAGADGAQQCQRCGVQAAAAIPGGARNRSRPLSPPLWS
jgi:hypothetical protein